MSPLLAFFLGLGTTSVISIGFLIVAIICIAKPDDGDAFEAVSSGKVVPLRKPGPAAPRLTRPTSTSSPQRCPR